MASFSDIIKKIREAAGKGKGNTKGAKTAKDKAGKAAVNLFESASPIFSAPARERRGIYAAKGPGGKIKFGGPRADVGAGRTLLGTRPARRFGTGGSIGGFASGVGVGGTGATVPKTFGERFSAGRSFMSDVNRGQRGLTSRIPGLSDSRLGAGASGLRTFGAGVTRFGAPIAGLSASHGMINELQNPSFSQLVDQNRGVGTAQAMGVGAARALGADRLLNLGIPGTGPVVRGSAVDPRGIGSKIQTDDELRAAERRAAFGSGTDLDTDQQVNEFKQRKFRELQAQGITDHDQLIAEVAAALNNEMAAASNERGVGGSTALASATNSMNQQLTPQQRQLMARAQSGLSTMPMDQTVSPDATQPSPSAQQSFVDFTSDEIDNLARQVIGAAGQARDESLESLRARQSEVLAQSQGITQEELAGLPEFRQQGEQRVMGIAQDVSDTAAAAQRQREADIAASQAALGPGVDIGAETTQGGAGIAGDQAAGQVLGEEMAKLNESAANDMELLANARQGRFEDDLKLVAMSMEGDIQATYHNTVTSLKESMLASAMDINAYEQKLILDNQYEQAANANSMAFDTSTLNRMDGIVEQSLAQDIYNVTGPDGSVSAVSVPAGGAKPSGYGQGYSVELANKNLISPENSHWSSMYDALVTGGVDSASAITYLMNNRGFGTGLTTDLQMMNLGLDQQGQIVDLSTGQVLGGGGISSLYQNSLAAGVNADIEAAMNEATR